MPNNQSPLSEYVVLINSDMYRELQEKPDKDKNLRALNYLLANTVAEQTEIEKRSIKTILMPGQVEAPLLKLSEAWQCDRKTVRSILDRLEAMEMICRHSDRYTTIVDMVCLLGWKTPDGFIANPLSKAAISFETPEAIEATPVTVEPQVAEPTAPAAEPVVMEKSESEQAKPEEKPTVVQQPTLFDDQPDFTDQQNPEVQ